MNTRRHTLNLILAAAAALPLAAGAADASIASDGWQSIGEALIFVGTPAGTGKTRAEVQAELAAYDRNAVGSDGWLQLGESLSYVGVPGAVGKSRAEVRAELEQTHGAQGLSHDGWQTHGDGTLSYLGGTLSHLGAKAVMLASADNDRDTVLTLADAGRAQADDFGDVQGRLRELVSASIPSRQASTASHSAKLEIGDVQGRLRELASASIPALQPAATAHDTEVAVMPENAGLRDQRLRHLVFGARI